MKMANKRLIYADEARAAVLKESPAIAYCIDEVKTVDAVEVVHGRWVKDQQSQFEHRYNCSACNYRLIDEPCNYCPNCGAKMDGGNEDG